MYVLALLFAVLCLGGVITLVKERFDWVGLLVTIVLGAAAAACFQSGERR